MKVGIVGGGICGLYLSWKLSKRGHSVFVFEKKKEIGKEVCSGLFSERILNFIPESKKLIENKIDFVLIHFPKKTIKVKFSKKFLVMNHYELDRLVADLAEREGVKILLEHPINSIPKNFDRVIGCDGAHSTIRKILGLKDLYFRLAIQGFIPSGNYIKENFVETWATKEGFVWKIPRKKEIEYGIISAPKVAKGLFEEFLRKNGLHLERVGSAIISQGLIIPSHKKVTLCGEAAGLTKPWSGGGVIWGLIAANILLKNFPDFLKYKKEVERFFSKRILFSKIATQLVYFFGFNLPWLLPRECKIESDFLI